MAHPFDHTISRTIPRCLGRALPFLVIPLLLVSCGDTQFTRDIPVESDPPAAELSEPDPAPVEDAEEPAVQEETPPPAEEAPPAANTGADAESPLSIIGAIPLPGEQPGRQIVLFFDQDIAPLESGGKPFSISPPVEGEFRTGRNYIAFTAANGFPDGHLFRVQVDPSLRSTSGQSLPAGQGLLHLATFTFEPKRLWHLGSQEDTVRLAILFPTDVSVEELRKHLSIRGLEEENIDCRLEPGSNSKTIRVILEGNETWPIRVTVGKGMRDQTGTFELGRDCVFGYPVDPFLKVKSVAWAGMHGDRRVVDVELSRTVAAEALEEHVAITDDTTGAPVSFELETTGVLASHRLLLDLETPDKGTLTVAVQKDLMSEDRARLAGDFTAKVDRSPDPLKVTSATWGRTGGREHLIYVRLSESVKAGDLREHLAVTDESSGEKIPFKLRTTGTRSNHTVVITPSQAYDVRVALAIAAGLRGRENTMLAEPYTTTLQRPSPPLRIEYTHWRNWPAEDGLVLWLNLNMAVKGADLQKHLKISPEVTGLRVEPESHQRYKVYADWRSETSYQVTLTEGLEYMGGGKSPKAATKQIKTQKVPKHVGFSHESKFYFPMRAANVLNVQSRNVERAEITLHRVFPSNLVVALSDMGVYSNSNNRNGSNRSSSVIHRWSEKLASKKLDLQYRPDYLSETPLDLETLLPTDTRGVFCVEARGADGGWGAKVILLTRIGALAHWRDKELMLFAHDLISLAPLATAKVSVYSSKNQLMGIANTGADGMVRFTNLDASLGTPRVAVIEHGKDFTFLELSIRDGGERPGLAGMPGYARDLYDGFVYADRDLYRPGETAHVRWIVRTNYGDALPDVSLLVTVKKPDGRPLLTQPTELSALGTGGLDIKTIQTHPTGKYTVELTVPGSARKVGSYQFSLEEFVPNRIETKAAIPAPHWTAEKPYEIQVSAQHLFGAPAADRRSTCSIQFSRADWKSDRWKGFQFRNDSEVTLDPVDCGEQRTDGEGKAAFSFSYTPPADITFPVKATAIAGVHELGGRVVVNTAETTFFPSDICLGIRTAKPESGQGIQVFAAAVKPDESPAALSSVKITLEKQVWNYYVRRYYSHYESNWSKSFDPVETQEVSLREGQGSAVFHPGGYGYYRVRVHSEATRQFSTFTFYAYNGRYNAVHTARPSLIKLAFDKETYDVGDEAVLCIESPFDGQGIVVMNGEDLQAMIPVTIKDNKGQVRFEVTEEHFPNVWAEVTVIHTVRTDRTQVYPFSSFAMANLRVNNPKRRLKVAFPDLPEEIRPAGKAEFALEVHDGAGKPVEAELTLAAVDEGIHAITNYQNPDPYAYLSRIRRQDYRRAHYYDKVAYDFEKPRPGGGASAKAARAQSMGETWIKPVALWSGVVRTDKQGHARVAMDLPEFNGKLRLVAVACTASATGAHSSNIFVRRPYMLRTSMPRFLLPGDKAQCRATLFNTTDAECLARVKWTTTGPLAAPGGERMLTLPAKGEATFLAEFIAGRVPGQTEIQWEALIQGKGGQELDRLVEAAPMPVRPPAAYQLHHDFIALQPGEARTVRNEKFVDDERVELEVRVSANPQMQVYDALRYCVRYPYGCIEQTTSAVLPMYALRASKQLVGEALENPEELDSYLQAGIDRLFSMQTASGGLGYWPGSRSPYPYGSTYALHFLTLAKRERELVVPEAPFKALQEYVRRIAGDWSRHEKPDLYRRAYALYVLCLDGDLKAIEQIQRFDAINLPQASRYLLAAALALNTRDTDRVKLYLTQMPSSPYDATERSGTLNSSVRNLAVQVLALEQIGGDTTELHAKAKKLLDYLKERRYGNTQEKAFAVTALAAYFKVWEGDPAQASATIVGPEGQKGVEGTEVCSVKHTGPAGQFTVSNTGKTPIFVDVTTAGVPLEANTEAYGEGVAIRRVLRTQHGDTYPINMFRQSDAHIIELELKCDQDIENLIVADLLPAGIEIENPRMRIELMPEAKLDKPIQPSFLDVRDDRLILAFNKIRKGTHHFYYVARAVTPGAYQYPPAVAECMYDASIKGASAAKSIEVKNHGDKE